MKNISKKEYIETLSKVVSFKTLTSDIEQNIKALDFVESKIDKRAIVSRIRNGNAQCMIAGNKKTRAPDVCFLVHIDVVAGRPDQFNMTIKKDIAYGRGVSDMKFSIPIGYTLLNDLIDGKSKLSFAFVVTTDEETGGYEGGAYLANKYKLKPKILIVPDGGDGLVFINRSKGVCQLRIDSIGKPAHSSRIWDGKNALESLIKLCNEVLERYKKNNKKESWKTTVNVGKLQGGAFTNQVCPEAYVTLDFRFPETTTSNAIIDEVRAIANRIDSSLKISKCSVGKPIFVDKKNPIVKLFIKSFENSFSQKIDIKGTYGASDARHFADLGIPILMIKPIGGDIHGENENVDIDSCLKFYEATRSFLIVLEQKRAQLHW